MQAVLSSARGRIPIAFAWMPLLAAMAILLNGCTAASQTESKDNQQGQIVQASYYTLPPDQLAHVTTVAVRTTAWPVDVHTTGTVDWDADHTTQAITQVSGPIARILVDTGTPVKKDDPLLYVSSPDLANAVANYRKARNREVFSKRIADRAKDLLDHGAVAQKDFESAEADYNDAMTDVQNSLQALKIFGITARDLDDAEKQGTPIRTEMALRSPIAGVVVQKMVSPGMLIQAGQTACFMISDVSSVWVQGHIFDRDLPSVRVGDRVDESNPSFPERFGGSVAYIGSSVDPATRTTPVRIVTQNPRGLLKKDMFVDAVVHTGTRSNVTVVPVSAVVRDDKNEPIVFVQMQPGRFAQRSITIDGQQNGLIAVTGGLNAGDVVVSQGSLFLQFAGQIQ